MRIPLRLNQHRPLPQSLTQLSTVPPPHQPVASRTYLILAKKAPSLNFFLCVVVYYFRKNFFLAPNRRSPNVRFAHEQQVKKTFFCVLMMPGWAKRSCLLFIFLKKVVVWIILITVVIWTCPEKFVIIYSRYVHFINTIIIIRHTVLPVHILFNSFNYRLLSKTSN